MSQFLRAIFCCFFFISTSLYAFAELEVQDPVRVSLISERQSVQPGHPFWLGIKMEIDEGWHTYWKNPGDAGMAIDFSWSLPKDFSVEAVEWPTPIRFALDSNVGFGYEGTSLFLVKVIPPEKSDLTEVEIAVDLRWVVCSDSLCLPGDERVVLSLPISDAESPLSPQATAFAEARLALPQKLHSFAAKYDQSLVAIVVTDTTSPSEAEWTHASFFPENPDAIDHKIEPVLSKTSEGKLQSVILKPQDQGMEQLKGILVLHSGESQRSFEVQLPVQSQQNEELFIGMEGRLASDSSPSVTYPQEFEGGLGLAIAMAFLGGMILNLMPCVLPVISFKVMNFIHLAGQSRRLIFNHGLAFAGGVVLSFWILAGALLILQGYGRSVGWGFQLQEPLFVAALSSILLVFGLSLFGVFEIGTGLTGLAGQAQTSSSKRGPLVSSFFSGILATAVATPCTGPFLGSAVGFAVTLPAYLSLSIFTSLGLGMSLPYLIFAVFPPLLRFLPKPGNWMVAFKELMGFVMFGTVLWLIWVFGAQTGSFGVFLLLSGFFFLALGCWIYGKWGTPVRKKLTRWIGYTLTLACFALAATTILASTSPWAEEMNGNSSPSSDFVAKSPGGLEWEKFSPERVDELRKQGVPVFVDFTAKWCLICQANHLILQVNEIAQEFSNRGVVKMKADWTKSDPIITAELKKYGRSGVPLYLLYGPNPKTPPSILPQVLTPEIVIEHLQNIDTQSS